MLAGVPKLEMRVLAFALVISAAHLGLIAYAAWELGISVPTCIEDPEGFAEPTFDQIDDDRFEAHIVGRMWRFEPNYLKLPTGATLDLYFSTADVVHGLQIAGTNVNLMGVPGAVANASVTFAKAGRYPVICHEYCGAAHHEMYAMIEVEDGAEAEAAGLGAMGIAEIVDEELPAAGDGAADEEFQEGMALLQAKGCLACHSLDGARGIGPSFKDLYGKEEKLADGSTVTVDEAYLRSSIMEPNKQVVEGYGALMPAMPLADEELEVIVKVLKEL